MFSELSVIFEYCRHLLHYLTHIDFVMLIEMLFVKDEYARNSVAGITVDKCIVLNCSCDGTSLLAIFEVKHIHEMHHLAQSYSALVYRYVNPYTSTVTDINVNLIQGHMSFYCLAIISLFCIIVVMDTSLSDSRSSDSQHMNVIRYGYFPVRLS